MTHLWAALPIVLAASSTLAQQCACPGPYGPYGPGGMRPQPGTCEAAYYENALWPNQYIGPARRGICQSTELMTANGWRRHNLLGKYHFEPNGEQLSEAGRLKTEWILTQAPANRRTVFVQRSGKPEQTAGRVESVHEYAASLAEAGERAAIEETNVRDEGYPAGAVDAVFTGFQANRPAPKLPTSSSGSSSGGSEQ